MKFPYKIVLPAAALLFSPGVWGQSMNDIYNLQRSTIQYGTPRFMGMGGAFGAVGGEISAASINPAAGAVAVKSELSFTFGPEWYNNSATYYGQKTKTSSKVNVTALQGGANFVFMTENPYSAVAGFNIGINYSRRNNFNNEVEFSGRNHTITDWLDGHPIGSSVVESMFRNAVDKTNGTVTKLATDLGVLEEIGGNIYPSADYNNIDQAARLLTSGYMGVTNFSVGININHSVYLGLGFDYYSLDLGDNNIYLDEWGYIGNDTYLHGGLSNLVYDRFTSQSGWGSAFSIGVIGKVTEQFRLGFSWKSAARIYIDEHYSYGMIAKFFDGTTNSGTEDPTYYIPNSYSFKSPSEWTFSAAYVFGQYGMISADYMIKDFSQMRFKDEWFRSENNIIAQQMQIAHTVRVGGELRLYPVSIRAGFNYSSSPYKDLILETASQTIPGGKDYAVRPQGVGATMGFSAGVGYSIGNFLTLDATYVHSSYKMYSYLYEPKLTEPVKNNITAGYVAIGATFRF